MKLKKSIFTKLIGCFILYGLILLFTFGACLVLEALLIGREIPPISILTR